MRTVIISISLLIISIFLVIGCEILENSIQKSDQIETEAIHHTSDIEKAESQQVNMKMTDLEADNKESLQKTDDS